MDTKIDTKAIGLLTQMNTRRKFFRSIPPAGCIELRFDTGVIMYVPEALAQNMVFHLEEADPTPPEAA